jgi:surface antigen
MIDSPERNESSTRVLSPRSGAVHRGAAIVDIASRITGSITKERRMLKKTTLAAAAALLALGLGTSGAMADECSGRDHTGGTVLGAIAGGVLGGAVSHGNGGAVIGGALLGGLAGNAISRDMDCEDRPYAARSYNDSFRGRIGRRYEWHRGPNRGYVVSNREYRRGRSICRDFTQVVYRHGREYDRRGTACRPQRGGDWRFH